ILLNNFLSDFPAMAIATDNVDNEWVDKPHRWNIGFVRDYMVVFGTVSSMFDYLTFGTLLVVLRASQELFRTGWFVESLMTELLVALVMRTRQLVFRSKPGRYLWISTVLVAVIGVILPYLPFSGVLGFVPLPAPVMLTLLGITVLYVITTEVAKQMFYKRRQF
ncbi:MAG: cation transporting ATPase C-terminal domain-containing protein, partial [Candidatus Bathyarchaeota archaeon]|nr:cation transporting ATPase C-terminal domain-containing protein [Candidatus Bathyarchaeota archaeon]